MRISWIIPEKKRPFHLIPQLAWHPNYALASVWIRAFQIAPYLRKLGYATSPNQPHPSPHIAVFLRRYDAEDVLLAKQLKQKGTKIVVDVIANYFQVRASQKTIAGRATQAQVDNFKRLIELADQVWTVSPFLQKAAENYHPTVRFISDSVDPYHFNPRQARPKQKKTTLTFGWSGISAKAADLCTLSPILLPLIASRKIQLHVIADKKPELNMPFHFRRWRYGRFPQDIADCDLCIAPRIVNNNFDRGHSLFKIGVFMAMGVPALAGPVPSYNLLLEDQSAGAICTSLQEWESFISRFMEDKEIQRSWSHNAADKMLPFLTPAVANQIHLAIQELLNQS